MPPRKRDEDDDDEPVEEEEELPQETASTDPDADVQAYIPPDEKFEGKLRRWLKTLRFPISIVILVIGTVVFLLGLFAWTPIANGPQLGPLEQALLGAGCTSGSNFVNGVCTSTAPDWTLAMLPGGGILALIGAYMASVYVVARRRFEHLMKTKSKAEFLRNLTEVEDLLWDLTPRDEMRLVRKKQALKIRG